MILGKFRFGIPDGFHHENVRVLMVRRRLWPLRRPVSIANAFVQRWPSRKEVFVSPKYQELGQHWIVGYWPC